MFIIAVIEVEDEVHEESVLLTNLSSGCVLYSLCIYCNVVGSNIGEYEFDDVDKESDGCNVFFFLFSFLADGAFGTMVILPGCNIDLFCLCIFMYVTPYKIYILRYVITII